MDINKSRADELIADIKEGKIQAIHFLFKNHYRPLCQMVSEILDGHLQTEDIVLDVFEKICDRMEIFNTVDEVELFLYHETQKACEVIVIAAQQRNGMLAVTDHQWTYYDELIEAKVLQAIHSEMEKLPSRRKEIFKLLFLYGLSSDEVAKKMRLSRQTILNQKAKALHTLRIALPKSKFY